jgi:hypothetical protein
MIEKYIAIDNVCAWPNLLQLADGTLLVIIFNQPTHASTEGDVECWASTDNGRMWRLRGIPGLHEPTTNRMNVSAGVRPDGAVVVVHSGWRDRPPVGQPRAVGGLENIIPAWTSISTDAGKTWEVIKGFPVSPEAGMAQLVPFGHIQTAANGDLCTVAYTGRIADAKGYNSSYLVRSADGGRTWGTPTIIGAGNYNETEPLHIGNGRWLAAARTLGKRELDLFVSTDDGRTWQRRERLALTQQHPAALLKMTDGRIVLSYGNRAPGHHGIDVRLSNDQGETWENILQIVDLPHCDLGYPSTAQIGPDQFVTVYYAAKAVSHTRYHMGVQIWGFDDFYGKKPS